MQRDSFTCLRCGDTETTLNVHHKKYIKGREPWEYELDNFETLCEVCHKVGHKKEEPKNPSCLTKFDIPKCFKTPEVVELHNEKLKRQDKLRDMPKDDGHLFEMAMEELERIMEIDKKISALIEAERKKLFYDNEK